MVRLPVDKAKGIRVLDNDFAIGGGAANAFGEKCAINGHIFACKKPDGDLGFVAVEGATLEASSLVGEAYDGSGFRFGAADVTSIDPKVARAQPFYAARTDNNGTFCHKYSFPRPSPAIRPDSAPNESNRRSSATMVTKIQQK